MILDEVKLSVQFPGGKSAKKKKEKGRWLQNDRVFITSNKAVTKNTQTGRYLLD